MRKEGAEALRALADQIENGAVDEIGPFIWNHKKGMIRLGATGEFPQGKITEEDEGELQIALAVRDNTLIIDFGKPITWLGLGKAEVIALAHLLAKRAEELT